RGASLSVTNVAFSGVGNDGIDGTNSGHTDTITDNQFDHVRGIAINLQTSPADLQRNVFTNDGSPAVKTSGGAVTIECSSLQSGGITADAQLTVKESDFSTGVGVPAPGWPTIRGPGSGMRRSMPRSPSTERTPSRRPGRATACRIHCTT